MAHVNDRDLTEAFAAAANIERMWRAAETTAALRRVNEHGYNGLTAAALEQAVASSGHSDPTAAAALTGLSRQVNDASLIAAWRRLTLEVERRMPTLTRPATPSKIERDTTDAGPGVHRPGSGECAACGRDFPGGRAQRDQVRAVKGSEGELLCYSHRTGWSAFTRGDIHRYIAQVKTWTSTELIPTGDEAA